LALPKPIQTPTVHQGKLSFRSIKKSKSMVQAPKGLRRSKEITDLPNPPPNK
jgi:hypothetical protein